MDEKMKQILFLTMLLSFVSGCSGHEDLGKVEDPTKGAPELSKVAEVDITRSVSPDGRFLTYTDWSTGNLAVRDLKSGEERHLTNKGSWLDSDEFALFSTISPDSQQFVFQQVGQGTDKDRALSNMVARRRQRIAGAAPAEADGQGCVGDQFGQARPAQARSIELHQAY